MADQSAFAALLALLGGALTAFLAGSAIAGEMCLAFAAAIVLIMWTPLRGWLGIPRVAMSDGQRIGYIGRAGSFGNLRKARLGKRLDVGIDNEGEVEASEAEFGIEDERDEATPQGEEPRR
jgi:hypothetical protein